MQRAFLKELKRWITGARFTSNNEVVRLIRGFIDGSLGDYEWDDFETSTEENPVAQLAIHLCWYYAWKYPSESSSEYCGAMAAPYFLLIASAIEAGEFNQLDHKAMIKSIENDLVPPEIEAIFGRIKGL